jgi:DnaJ-class molecular chaperone
MTEATGAQTQAARGRECPSCGGAKTVRALVNYGRQRGCVWEQIPCITCHGQGEISEEEALAIEERDRIRNERVARGESMKDAATRLGMTLREYNDFEHGRTP